MKDAKKLFLVLASAALLSACGGNNNGDNTSSQETTSELPAPGASINGLNVDYTSDENLLSVATLSKTYSGGFVYTPKANTEVYLVPTFAGANELDYVEINDTRYNAETGDASLKFNTYMGELSLEGQSYVKFIMPNEAVTIKAHSKTVEGGTLRRVTIHTTESANGFNSVPTVTMNDEGEKPTFTRSEQTQGSIDTYFKTAGTHEVEVLEGKMAGFIVGGEGLELYHKGLFKYSASVNSTPVAINTLESSINGKMKTTGLFKMPTSDVTLEVKLSAGYKYGKAMMPVHGGTYVGVAESYSVTSTNHSTGASTTKVYGATLKEYELPQAITVQKDGLTANEDYVEGKVWSHGKEANGAWYKTIQIGNTQAVASVNQEGWLEYSYNFYDKDALAAYIEAVKANDVYAVTSNGNVQMGAAEMDKDLNGYGGTRFDWKYNRDATVAAFIEYGPDGLLNATKPNGGKEWGIPTGDDEYAMTGATWTDLNPAQHSTSYEYATYAELMKMAFDNSTVVE